MAKFGEWLVGREHVDSGIHDLVDSIVKNVEKWKTVSTLEEAIKFIDDSSEIKQNQKPNYRNYVTRSWYVYLQEEKSAKEARGKIEIISRWATVIVSSLLAIAVLAFIFIATLVPNFVDSLAEDTHARGLITFFFALVTVGISLILVVAVFTSSVENIKERFDMGKDVLTAVIGVFGTIVGFYFGVAIADNDPNLNDRVTDVSILSGQDASGATGNENPVQQSPDQRGEQLGGPTPAEGDVGGAEIPGLPAQ